MCCKAMLLRNNNVENLSANKTYRLLLLLIILVYTPEVYGVSVVPQPSRLQVSEETKEVIISSSKRCETGWLKRNIDL